VCSATLLKVSGKGGSDHASPVLFTTMEAVAG